MGNRAGGEATGEGLGGGGLDLALALELFDTQVVPAANVGVGQAAAGEPGQHFGGGLLPFGPLRGSSLDLVPGAAVGAFGADAILQGEGKTVQAKGLVHPAPLAAFGVRTGAVGVTG